MKKLILKSVLAAAILVFCLAVTGLMTTPKWVTGHNPQTLQTEGFRDLESRSLDILVLGSCQSYQGFNPAVFWNETGLTSYVLASPDQRMYTSYYYLKYAFRTQSPKLVLIDALFLIDPNTPSAALDSKAYVPMPLGPDKLALSDYSFNYCYKGDRCVPQYLFDRADNFFKTVFPVLKFHARTDYTENDLRYLTGADFDICYAGGIPFYYTRDVSAYDGYMTGSAETVGPDASALEYLGKIKSFCDENGAIPVLYKTPSPSMWDRASLEAASLAAEELGIDYVDFNLDGYREFFDLASDFHTAWKLNASGMEKQTLLLGEYVTEKYGGLFELPHSENTAEYWDALYEKYAEYDANKEFIFLED